MDVISSNAPKNYAVNGKIMVCSLIIFSVAVFLIFTFHGYASRFFDCIRGRRLRQRSRRHNHLSSRSSAAPNPSSGLDAAVINSIPSFFYSADGPHNQPLECAVCISEFENDETFRVLPQCKHTFHVDCIDMWFHSHTNCPLCRAPVQSIVRVDPTGTSTPGETGTPAPEPNDSGGEDEVNACSSAGCGRKPLDLLLLEIVVETPVAENGSGRMEDSGQTRFVR